jgi:hypothetical protein
MANKTRILADLAGHTPPAEFMQEVLLLRKLLRSF